jgi:CRISPR-associated protein Cmr5
MQTRSQKYAALIYKQVEDFQRDHNAGDQKQYGSMAHKLPVLIRTAGLSQALGFVAARGNAIHLRLVQDLTATLGRRDLPDESRKAPNLQAYMRMTQETLDALLWYKRFAQSVLKVDASDELGGVDADKT